MRLRVEGFCIKSLELEEGVNKDERDEATRTEVQRVVLIAVGNRKIEVIKEVLAITGLGLKGSKDIVDAAPSTIKQGVNMDEATKLKAQLEAVGATVEIR